MPALEIFFKSQKFVQMIVVEDDASVSQSCPILSHKIYDLVEQHLSLELNQMVVVLRAWAAENPKILSILSNIYSILETTHQCKITKTFFFLEELVKTDKSGRTKELEFITSLIFRKPHSYDIYSCERLSGIKYFDWYVADQIFYLYENRQQPLSLKFDNIFSCFNNRFDERRYTISAWLSSQQVPVDLSQHYSIPISEVEKFSLIPETYRQDVINGAKILENKGGIRSRDMPVIPAPDYISYNAVAELIYRTQSAFCSIVTESKYEKPGANFSEKTLRSIYSGRPFILLAPQGTLKLLQSLGIKTFSDFWDESYDQIADPKKRLTSIIDQLQYIINCNDHRSQLERMLPILEHNQQILNSIPSRMFTINDLGHDRL